MANRVADRMHDVPLVARAQRTGASRIEQRGVARVREHVSRMPASLVVQLALWPDELARWARAERIAESVVYNLLAGRKPYLRMRERLAAHLGVQTGHLASLVDGVIDEPTSTGPTGERAPAPSAPPGENRRRSGANPLERRAVEVVAREIAAMPAATVVGLAIWPETLTEWARAHGFKPSAVWATLAGTPSEIVAAGLARRLDVSVREVVALIEAERPPAGAATVFAARPAEPAAAEPPVSSPPAARAPTRPADPGSSAAPSGRPKSTSIDQLSLGL
jgi:hypothetical protein